MSTVKYQYFATICANIVTVVHGMLVGWSSPTLPNLIENDILDSGPITVEEGSWVSSLICIGGMFGTILYGWMADRFGRKISLMAIVLPQFLAWLLIELAPNVYCLYVARILGGISGGAIFVVLPIYVSEISEDKIRGTMGSVLLLSCNVGILLGFIIGAYLDYHTVPYIVFVFIGLFGMSFPFFPETPQYLFLRNRDEEAKKSFQYFRDISDFMAQISTEFKLELEVVKHSTKISKDKEKITCADFKPSTTRRALVISAVIMMGTQLCGVFAMMNYATSIFKDAGSNLTPDMSSVIIAMIQLVGSYLSVILVDKAGRKILMIGSAFGTGASLTAMAIYSYLKYLEIDVTSFAWVPIAALSGVVLIASIGVATLPFLIVTEIIPTKIRGTVATICTFTLWFLSFFMVKFFNNAVNLIGLHGFMITLALYCFFESIFVAIYMPETKGKCFDEIIQVLKKK